MVSQTSVSGRDPRLTHAFIMFEEAEAQMVKWLVEFSRSVVSNSFSVTWMHLEITILNEVAQKDTTICEEEQIFRPYSQEHELELGSSTFLYP